MNIKTPVTANPGRLLASADGRCSCCDWTYKELAEAARAINAHDALVAALEELLRIFTSIDGIDAGIDCVNESAATRAEAALKLAKGGE